MFELYFNKRFTLKVIFHYGILIELPFLPSLWIGNNDLTQCFYHDFKFVFQFGQFAILDVYFNQGGRKYNNLVIERATKQLVDPSHYKYYHLIVKHEDTLYSGAIDVFVFEISPYVYYYAGIDSSCKPVSYDYYTVRNKAVSVNTFIKRLEMDRYTHLANRIKHFGLIPSFDKYTIPSPSGIFAP